MYSFISEFQARVFLFCHLHAIANYVLWNKDVAFWRLIDKIFTDQLIEKNFKELSLC